MPPSVNLWSLLAVPVIAFIHKSWYGLIIALYILLRCHRVRGKLRMKQLHKICAMDYKSVESADPTILAPKGEWIHIENHRIFSLYFREEEISEDKTQTLFLFCPGNPGVPHFYVPTMQHFATRLSEVLEYSSYELRTIAYDGHCMPWRSSSGRYNLDHQIQHVVQYVTYRVKQNPQLRIYLVGHSIGCHILLKVLQTFPDHVVKVALIHPAIHHIAKSEAGMRLKLLLGYYSITVNMLSWMHFLIPEPLQDYIVRKIIGTHIQDVIQQAALSLLNKDVMMNVLCMAASAMKEVLAVDEDLLLQHQSKILFVYSPADHWVPTENVREIMDKFLLSSHRYVSHPHAFMLNPNGSKDMAEALRTWFYPSS